MDLVRLTEQVDELLQISRTNYDLQVRLAYMYGYLPAQAGLLDWRR